MRPASLAPAVIGLFLLAAGGGAQQMTPDQARQEGRDLANAARANSSLTLTSDAQARAVPGYTGTSQPQESYFNDPDRLSADGNAQAGSDDAFRTVTDPQHLRPTFSNSDLFATTARATAIEKDPTTYLANESVSATNGTCTPLPPSQGAPGYYDATCDSGTQVRDSAPSCSVPLAVDVTPGTTKYLYTCQTWNQPGNLAERCGTLFDAPVAGGVCHAKSRRTVTYRVCLQGTLDHCTEPDDRDGEEITYECDSSAVSRPYTTEQVDAQITDREDETQCTSATSGKTCELASETCADSDPVARLISGVSVTRSCWAWQRQYSCHQLAPGDDCSALEANAQCSYVRNDCLDDPVDGPCKVTEKVYRCPTPGARGNNPKQYICGGDVYCLNGDCEPIERQASTEFKDALVGLHALGDASSGLDPANLTVFSGERDTCHHKLFGLSNCCSGKGVPLITPWLCSSAEQDLDKKDDKGLCHQVGSYCSDKVLGICVTKKEAYCCFESKLSRILQEQGRAQIGRPWGNPKSERCKGFTIAEFQRLDLSRMNFTEVYSDFVDAARLPDEIQTISDIQQKIQDFYALHS